MLSFDISVFVQHYFTTLPALLTITKREPGCSIVCQYEGANFLLLSDSPNCLSTETQYCCSFNQRHREEYKAASLALSSPPFCIIYLRVPVLRVDFALQNTLERGYFDAVDGSSKPYSQRRGAESLLIYEHWEDRFRLWLHQHKLRCDIMALNQEGHRNKIIRLKTKKNFDFSSYLCFVSSQHMMTVTI